MIARLDVGVSRVAAGYDLAHLRDEQGRLDINSLLCGSEGSLGLLNEAVLNVLPIPRHATLANVRYAGFMDALRDAKALMASDCRPTSIETVDDKVLLAMEDFVWDSVAEFFPATDAAEGASGSNDTATAARTVLALRGINLVEFNDDDPERLAERVDANAGRLLATGYSCRSQVKRLSGQALPHPLQALLGALQYVQPKPNAMES